MGRKKLTAGKTARTRSLEQLAARSWEIPAELDIARDRDKLSYKAAVIIWFTLNAPGLPIKDYSTIAGWLGLSLSDAYTIYGNWRHNKLLRPDGRPVVEVAYPPEHEQYELSFIIGVTMTALAGAGELCRVVVEQKGEGPDKGEKEAPQGVNLT